MRVAYKQSVTLTLCKLEIRIPLRKSSGSWSNLRFEHIPTTSLNTINPWAFASHFNLASPENFPTCIGTCKDTLVFTKIVHRAINLNIWIGSDWIFGCTSNTWTKLLKFSLFWYVNFCALNIQSKNCFGDACDDHTR